MTAQILSNQSDWTKRWSHKGCLAFKNPNPSDSVLGRVARQTEMTQPAAVFVFFASLPWNKKEKSNLHNLLLLWFKEVAPARCADSTCFEWVLKGKLLASCALLLVCRFFFSHRSAEITGAKSCLSGVSAERQGHSLLREGPLHDQWSPTEVSEPRSWTTATAIDMEMQIYHKMSPPTGVLRNEIIQEFHFMRGKSQSYCNYTAMGALILL